MKLKISVLALLLLAMSCDRKSDKERELEAKIHELEAKKQQDSMNKVPSETTTLDSLQSMKLSETQEYIGVTSMNQVKSFLSDIGNGRLKSAFKRQRNPQWTNFDKFASADKGFGGVKQVVIKEMLTVSETDTDAKIYTQYFAADPANKDAVYEMYYFLKKKNDQWFITGAQKIAESQTSVPSGKKSLADDATEGTATEPMVQKSTPQTTTSSKGKTYAFVVISYDQYDSDKKFIGSEQYVSNIVETDNLSGEAQEKLIDKAESQLRNSGDFGKRDKVIDRKCYTSKNYTDATTKRRNAMN